MVANYMSSNSCGVSLILIYFCLTKAAGLERCTCCCLGEEEDVSSSGYHDPDAGNNLSKLTYTSSRLMRMNRARMSPKIMKRKGITE